MFVQYYPWCLQLGTVNITPVIGNLGEIDPNHLRTNPAEVNWVYRVDAVQYMIIFVVQVYSVFSLSLEHLADPANHRYTIFKSYKVYFPVFLGGSQRVWGITGFILDTALKHILPSELNYQPVSRGR